MRAQSRQKLKRVLLDQLDELHKFAAPPTLIEDEFNNVWKTVLSDLESQNKTFADEGTTEEKAREEYRTSPTAACGSGSCLPKSARRTISRSRTKSLDARRLSERGSSPARSSRSGNIIARTRKRSRSMRAPIYEEKVVDFLLELASVTDKPVSREELFKAEDDEEASA